MLAAAGVGLHDEVVSAARAMASPRSELLLPRAECREVHDALYRRHRALYAALCPLVT
jgi:ribulose kinase